MYYDRTLSDGFAKLIGPGGELRWLFDYVKNNNELDFLIGKAKNKEWIYIYRGLSRILAILRRDDTYITDAAKAYKQIAEEQGLSLYGQKKDIILSGDNLSILISGIATEKKLSKHYANKKEGYFQNLLSRGYGICGMPTDDLVIIDKEVVIGYQDTKEKTTKYEPIRKQYKELQKAISEFNKVKYGKDLEKKPIGNEVDFLALDKDGNILIIEYKHGTNTSGIYLSPLQIGLYYNLFTNYHKETGSLYKAVLSMFEQKQRIGLINPEWSKPSTIKSLIPVLIISEYNEKSVSREYFRNILKFVRKATNNQDFLNNIKIYNCPSESKELVPMDWR